MDRMKNKPVEIVCAACGAEAVLLRRPLYEGFKRTGESLCCAACGHVYADEAQVPFKVRAAPQVFTAADRSPAVEVFREDEAQRLCRHCESYVVNPFVQRCSRHGREVEATDTCADFAPRPVPPQPASPPQDS